MSNILNLLIVDDDPGIIRLLTRYFEKHSINVTAATNEQELQDVLQTGAPDIILLDLMFPDVQGFELLEKLRNKYDIGIMMMTGHEDPVDKIVGLELGADDYIYKPFELRELLARVRSLYRRTCKPPAGQIDSKDKPGSLAFDGFQFHIRSRFLFSPDKIIIKLTSHETNLLVMFLYSQNEVLNRKILVKEVFGRDWGAEDRSIDILVSKLRRKLGKKEIIANERGRGYRFIPQVVSGNNAAH